MNTEKLLDMLKKKMDTVEFAAKEKSIKLIEDIYTSSEKTQIEKWKNDRNFLYSLVKRNNYRFKIVSVSKKNSYPNNDDDDYYYVMWWIIIL